MGFPGWRGFRDLPEWRQAAFEFRHPSWFADEVFDALRAGNAALCIAESDNIERNAPLVATAAWGYLRLRPGTDGRELDEIFLGFILFARIVDALRWR